jgi:NodT family efflux transporter outer membrane factor (OMF) lipoprotein
MSSHFIRQKCQKENMPDRLIASPARAWLLAACAGALAACAHAPGNEAALPVVAVPVSWSGQAESNTQATDLAQWWTRLQDPQLTALIGQALRANTDVRSARASLLQARALRDVSAAGLLLQLGSSASAQRSRSGGNPAGNSFAAGFDASWEPDIFGGKHSALGAAQAEAGAALSTLSQVQVSLAAETALGYIELRSLQARLEIARTSLVSQADTLQIARWRTQAGLTSELDVAQAVAANEQMRAQMAALQSSVGLAFNTLAVLTGSTPGTLQGRLGAAAVPLPPGELTLSLPADALRQRPDVQAAEQRISAALQRLAQADAARYPGFQIGGSLGLRALTLGALSNGASVASSLLASVSVPLFDGGAARAQVRVQDAALEQSRVAYEATVLGALKEVEDALVSLRGDSERLLRLQTAADAAAGADEMARQRYSSGLVDFQTVLETQRSRLNLQDSVASAGAAVSADHVRLYKALGGGWRPDSAAASDPQNEVATRNARP